MRAAIYARVSTADGRQDTENQLAELRQFANTQDWQRFHCEIRIDQAEGRTCAFSRDCS